MATAQRTLTMTDSRIDASGDIDRSLRDPISPRIWPLLLLCAFAGLWIDFGTLNYYHQSDTVVPILVSLQKWTPYYWEQNRFGMLVPLLASPIRNPWHNLLFQNALTASSGLAAFFLISRYVIRDWTWPLVASIGASGFLVFSSPDFRSFYLSTGQPYNVALFLGFAGLLLVERYHLHRGPAWLIVIATLAILLSQWVNGAGFLIMVPLALFRHIATIVTEKSDEATENHRSSTKKLTSLMLKSLLSLKNKKSIIYLELALLATGAVFGTVAQKISPYQTTWISVPPPLEWISRISAIGSDLQKLLAVQLWPRILVLAAGIGLAASCLQTVRRRTNGAMLTLVVTVGASLVYAAIMTVLFPPHARYLLPGLIIMGTGLVWFTLSPILSLLTNGQRKVLLATSAPCLLVSVLISDGFPSASRTRDVVDANLGTMTSDLIASHSTHLAGDYWKVWTSILHANMIKYEKGAKDQVWGVSFRSLPSRELWGRTNPSDLRVAVSAGDEDRARHYLLLYDFPVLQASDKFKTITSYHKK